ncbi:hypothetical protein [Pseudomonas sp.]|uniref:hypothetical protein n=1 Tax=Pseudomonas sp. TaxID=306 RepID=UPI00333F163F
MKNAIVGLTLALACTAVIAKDFTPSQKNKLQAAVKAQLIDEDSAKFKLPPYQGGDLYCGQVNSKNRMGGYTGYTVFQAAVLPGTTSGFYLLGIGSGDPSDPSTSALIQACSEKGYIFR